MINVLPQWDSLVVESVHSAGGEPLLIAAGYTALLAAFWLHAFAFYALITKLGATTAGVCKVKPFLKPYRLGLGFGAA